MAGDVKLLRRRPFVFCVVGGLRRLHAGLPIDLKARLSVGDESVGVVILQNYSMSTLVACFIGRVFSHVARSKHSMSVHTDPRAGIENMLLLNGPVRSMAVLTL
jgi:hypothetical protein